MLKHKRFQLSQVDWEDLVRRTEESIMKSPEQYFLEPPKKVILDLMIHSLFNEFLNESI